MPFTTSVFILWNGNITVFNGSKVEGMTDAFMLHVRDGPIYVVFVNKRTNKVFLMEYKGTPIPKFLYTEEYSFRGVSFKFIDLTQFKPREDCQDGTNTGCQALSIDDVTEEMKSSFVRVFTSFGKKKKPTKVVKPAPRAKKVEFADQTAFQEAPAPEEKQPNKQRKRVRFAGVTALQKASAPEENPRATGQAKNARQERQERIAYLQNMLAKAKQDEKDAEEERLFQEKEKELIESLAGFGINVS